MKLEGHLAGRQRIDRVRRQYNQWVANQTLEDYALRFTAKSARKWSSLRVANQDELTHLKRLIHQIEQGNSAP